LKAERKRRYYDYQPVPMRTVNCTVCGVVFKTNGSGHSRKACWLCRGEYRRAVRRNNRHSYRARLKAARANTDVTPRFIAQLRRRTTHCELCLTSLGPDAHLDHIVPLAIGGTHTRDNLRFLCPTCNCSRPIDGSDVTDHQLNIWMAA
jgi:5-methylcytosine-specific restriction endonuclease McrA